MHRELRLFQVVRLRPLIDWLLRRLIALCKERSLFVAEHPVFINCTCLMLDRLKETWTLCDFAREEALRDCITLLLLTFLFTFYQFFLFANGSEFLQAQLVVRIWELLNKAFLARIL